MWTTLSLNVGGSSAGAVLEISTNAEAAAICQRIATLLDQAVDAPRILARHLPDDVVRKMLELLADVLLGFRAHAVGVRIVGAPHQRLEAHLVDELRAHAVVLERRLALAPPVPARQHLERQLGVLVREL